MRGASQIVSFDSRTNVTVHRESREVKVRKLTELVHVVHVDDAKARNTRALRHIRGVAEQRARAPGGVNVAFCADHISAHTKKRLHQLLVVPIVRPAAAKLEDEIE